MPNLRNMLQMQQMQQCFLWRRRSAINEMMLLQESGDGEMLRCGGIEEGLAAPNPYTISSESLYNYDIRSGWRMGYILEEHFVTLSRRWH